MNLDFSGHKCMYCGCKHNNEDRKGEAVFICDNCNKPGGNRDNDCLCVGGRS